MTVPYREYLIGRAAVPPTARRKLNHQQRQTIATQYRAGAAMTDLARRHGVNVYTIRRTLIDAGVELRANTLRGKPFGSLNTPITNARRSP